MRMSNLQLQCACGKVRGVLHNATPQYGNRIVCHCDDCQAFSNYLGVGNILDEHNGTDLYQTSFAQVEITEGTEHMRSIQLRPKGLIRWYADCCKTPIGNTMSASMPFIGIVHTFMGDANIREKTIGPVRAHAFLKKGSSSYHLHTPLIKMLPRMFRKMMLWKLRDSKKPNPFFTKEGVPVSKPRILS